LVDAAREIVCAIKKALAYIRQGLSAIHPSNINKIREGLDQNDGLFKCYSKL
jgi:uncharacterized protein (DUF2342 family)